MMFDTILASIEQIEPNTQRLGQFEELVVTAGAVMLAGGSILTLIFGKKRLMPPYDEEMKKLLGIVLGVVSALIVGGLYWLNSSEPGPDLWRVVIIAAPASLIAVVLYAISYWALVFTPKTLGTGPVIAGLWPLAEARQVMRGNFTGLPRQRQITSGPIPRNSHDYFDASGGDAAFIWPKPALILSRLLLGTLFTIMTFGFVAALTAASLELNELEKDVTKEPGRIVVTLPGDILFAYNSAELPAHAPADLAEVVSLVAESSPVSASVTGHTDGIGSKAFNQSLSEQRAQAVADWLLAHGLPADLPLEILGKGETAPLFRETDDTGRDLPEARQRNRRVEIVLNLGD